jgi:menaquinone-dependent protoporphyrinogen oxidase
MAKILIVYSTTDGHTRKISDRIQHFLGELGHDATLVPIDEVSEKIETIDFDKIVLGASIRYGKHSRRVYRFVKRYHHLLENEPNAFFSVNLTSRKPEKETPETNPYMNKFLRQIPWRPQKLALFAGKLDYPSYRLIDRLMIQFIMAITRGPTDPTAIVEYTDWSKVDAFALDINEM